MTMDLQTYRLVVTAEPYFAVTMPSDVVVLQNDVIKHKTKGIIDTANVHYTLLPRGAYVQTADSMRCWIRSPAPKNRLWNSGRAKNRRVQLVVCGAAIGVGQPSAPGARDAAAAPDNNSGSAIRPASSARRLSARCRTALRQAEPPISKARSQRR